MFHDDEEIESLLKRFRPVGPPPDLKKRIFPPARPQSPTFLEKATPENCLIPAPTVREGVKTPVLGSKNRIFSSFQKYKWAVAAAVVIAFGAAALWLSQPKIEDRLPDESAQDQAFQDIIHAGQAAQLLAAADLLAKQPGGLKYAREQYEYITQTYAHMEAAVTAQSKLKSLSERSEYHD